MPLSERALGPDLARGFMLLFIALANSHYFLRGSDYWGGFPIDETWIDSITAWLISTCIDGRAYPMFGLLFGYGVAQIVRRHEARGRKVVRRILWRRAGMLLVVGFLHALLLFEGDILTAYGTTLLIGAWLVFWRSGWLWLLGISTLVLLALPNVDSYAVGLWAPDAALLPNDLREQIPARASASFYVGMIGPIAFVFPFAAGMWAGRRRLLEQPAQHRRLLLTVAIVGIGLGVVCAQPAALVHLGAYGIPGDSSREWMGPFHDISGYFAGAGYASLIALVSLRWASQPGRVVTAIAAVGQRSMTCYLCQSVVWTIVFTPYLLDLSRPMSPFTTALLSFATWGATVLLADWMRRTGRRGPFEVLLRRVTYRALK